MCRYLVALYPRPVVRMRGLAALTVLVIFGVVVPAVASGQVMLTLSEAMARARNDAPAAKAATAAADEAGARIRGARAAYLPRVEASEGVQRGDQPVFVFGSLLSQRQFTAANFDLAALNHPSPLTNVRSSLNVEQSVFDGVSRLQVDGARLGRDLAVSEQARVIQDLALVAAEAFVRVLTLEEAERADAGAVRAADSDLQRAQARRDAGLVTDADVLTMDVHLADVRQRQIATSGELAVARMRLNDAIGAPLDQPLALVTPVAGAAAPAADLVDAALRARPERRASGLRLQIAEHALRAARAAFLPTVSVQGAWEFNGDDWAHRQSSWLIGAQARINVFNGFSDAARVAAARAARARATSEQVQVDRQIELDVRASVARLDAARARDRTGQAALMHARESQRIVRDRYEAGLATATDLLRAAESVLDAESRATAARMDVILQTVALDRAVGRL